MVNDTLLNDRYQEQVKSYACWVCFGIRWRTPDKQNKRQLSDDILRVHTNLLANDTNKKKEADKNMLMTKLPT